MPDLDTIFSITSRAYGSIMGLLQCHLLKIRPDIVTNNFQIHTIKTKLHVYLMGYTMETGVAHLHAIQASGQTHCIKQQSSASGVQCPDDQCLTNLSQDQDNGNSAKDKKKPCTKLKFGSCCTEYHSVGDCLLMMTSSNGSGCRVIDPLWGESTGHRWITLTKDQLMFLWC